MEDALVEDAEGITNEPEPGPEPKRSYNPHDYTLQRNPDHYIGKVILRESDGTCFIKGKIPGGCQHTGPCFAAVTVPCPKEMLDPAYAQCRAGVVYENPADHTCGCWEIGNPARFHLNDCPEETK